MTRRAVRPEVATAAVRAVELMESGTPIVRRSLVERLKALARSADDAGTMSTGEQCAVALLCNRAALLPRGFSWLDAVDRVGAEWLTAMIVARREGWH